MLRTMFCLAALMAAPAVAAPILPGQTLTNQTVLGTQSVYGVFGQSGSVNENSLPQASLFQFGAGGGNVFSFAARGTIGCCGGPDASFTPDGAPGGTSIFGKNGLSDIFGNSRIPLVGVFTTDTSPVGSMPPAFLTFDAANPASLSPLLRQVFYIGDGRAGYNNAAGALLSFTAPTDATRLWIGTIDALGFSGPTGFYADNPGSFSVDISLAGNAIPEPATWAMMIAGFGFIGGAARRVATRVPVQA